MRDMCAHWLQAPVASVASNARRAEQGDDGLLVDAEQLEEEVVRPKLGSIGVGAALRAYWNASVQEEVETRFNSVRARALQRPAAPPPAVCAHTLGLWLEQMGLCAGVCTDARGLGARGCWRHGRAQGPAGEREAAKADGGGPEAAVSGGHTRGLCPAGGDTANERLPAKGVFIVPFHCLPPSTCQAGRDDHKV